MDPGASIDATWEQSGDSCKQFNGVTQNFYHYGTKDENIATTPVSNVPFLRDPNFVERSEYRHVTEKLNSGRTRIALNGLGGVGKSQLAIEYCYRTREQSPDSWVFWIHASSSARLDAGIRELADILKLPQRHDKNVNIFQLVESWLRGSGSKWLLVLDNADSEEVLFQPLDDAKTASSSTSKKKIVDFLAIPSCGQTILTTRYKKVASKFVDECDIITLGPMIKPDAVALFHGNSKAGKQQSDTDAQELVDELGCIPLAVVQAAAFIGSKVPPWPIETYLTMLRDSIRSDASLLKADFDERRRDSHEPEATNSVFNTWKISFDYICQIRESAADRLYLMTFFDHRSIPRSLLHTRESADSESELTTNHDIKDDTLDEDIFMLDAFHLISVGIESDDVVIHPLVQLAVRTWLTLQGDEDHWRGKSIKNLRSALPAVSIKSTTCWRTLFPHVLLAFQSEPQTDLARLNLAYICSLASFYLFMSDKQQASMLWQRRCLVERQHVLGDDHLHTLKAESKLGEMLHFSGYVEEAREAFEHCLTLAERYSDSDHEWRASLAETLMRMGTFEVRQGQLTDAELHLRRALGYFDDLPAGGTRASCVRSLVDVLLGQDKLSEAENLCRQSLQGYMEAYGSENMFTLDAIRQLGEILDISGRTDDALKMYMRALEGYRRIDADSLCTLPTMFEIAGVLAKQRKLRAAASLFEQVYQRSIDCYGPETSFTLLYGERYAIELMMLKKNDQAIDLMRSCAMISHRTFGSNHRDAVKRARLVAEWEQAELERKVKRSEIRLMWILFWPFLVVKFLESRVAVAVLSLISALRSVGNILTACIDLAIALLRVYLIETFRKLVDLLSRVSGMDLFVLQ